MENKLMMKLTIGSEAIFFISLIMAYLFFWKSGHFAAAVTQHLHVLLTSLFTLLLVSSSLTFFLAERSYKKKKFTSMKIWLLTTILLGIIFLAGQGHEYYELIQKQVTISQSEFGSSFFALTGFHGLHVLIGLILLLIIFFLFMTGYFMNRSTSLIRTIGIYWHFIDAVWLVVFTIIYLLPYIL